MKKTLLLIAVTLIISVSILTVSNLIASSVPSVQAIHLVSGDLKSTISCKGTITPENTQSISYGYTLKIKKVFVKIGDTVKPGDKLITIDKDATIQANNSLSAQTKTGTSSALSENELGALASQYGLGILGSSSQSMAAFSSKTDELTTGYDIPDTITATLSGVITAINVKEGEFTNPTSVILEISNVNQLQVSAQVDESQIKSVKLNQKAYISGVGFVNRYSGKVAVIYPQAQQIINSGNINNVINVIINIDNPSSELKPNLTCDVSIVISDDKGAITVPYGAVCQDNKNIEYVYLYINGKAVRQNITTGGEFVNDVQVLRGLKSGDKVILNPPEQLKSGGPVRIASVSSETEAD